MLGYFKAWHRVTCPVGRQRKGGRQGARSKATDEGRRREREGEDLGSRAPGLARAQHCLVGPRCPAGVDLRRMGRRQSFFPKINEIDSTLHEYK